MKQLSMLAFTALLLSVAVGTASGQAPPCVHQFTANATTSNVYLQYCVADDGVISSIQTPYGHVHQGPWAYGEGFGLCQESPIVEYHDYEGDVSANWKSPQLLSLTSSAIKISRTTADGNWKLVQTISKVPATGSIKIVMALTNNQSVDRVAYLVRYVNIQPDGLALYEMESAVQSVAAWDADRPGAHYGLILRNAALWKGYQQGFIQTVRTGPNACAFAFNADPSGLYSGFKGDESLVYAYVGTIPALGTKTFTLVYSPM